MINILILIICSISILISLTIQIKRAKRYNNGVNNLRKAFMVNLSLFLIYLIKILLDATLYNEPVYNIFNSILLLSISLSVFLFYQENEFAFFTKQYWVKKFNKKKRG